MTEPSVLPRIVPLDLATVELPNWHPARHLGVTIPCLGHAIDHPEGIVVVDTGVGYGNDFIDEVYAPSRTAVDDALAGHGLDPARVVAVVNSHLHFDHCGTVSTFVEVAEPGVSAT